MKKITTPLDKKTALWLKSGDRVLLSGYIYTSRDAGHKRMCEALQRGEELPIDLINSVIYCVGPTPAKEGEVIGSAGPTTSGRMDAYAPMLMEKGLRGMIGKGERNGEVVNAMQKNGCVYFGAIGGAGALLSQCIKENTPIAYEDLGAEALCRLLVEDMPLTVIIDASGNNLYKTGRENYLNK
jgi:fumarate hydratase subunit beta